MFAMRTIPRYLVLAMAFTRTVISQDDCLAYASHYAAISYYLLSAPDECLCAQNNANNEFVMENGKTVTRYDCKHLKMNAL